MSVLARRGRDEQFERQRELVAMRDAVVTATTAYMPTAGSSATLEAVDEALAQLVASGAHLADAEQVKGLWIQTARYRLIDAQRSSDAKRRDTTSVDDHPVVLELSVCDHPGELLDEQRQFWRVREILSVLRGEQRKWADAWYREVLSLPAGAQPRGLPEVLGWSSTKTQKISQRARRKMAEFVMQRQAGLVCDEQQALLDAFVTAGTPGHALTDELDQERYEALLFHFAGCDDCFAAWQARRRNAFARPLAILMLPLDGIVGAAQAFAAKVAGVTTAVATSVLGRLGIGGAAAAGSGAATIGAKATAVCVGVVCAATAGGEIAGVLPPIVSAPAPATRTQQDAPQHAKTPAAPAPVTSGPVTPAVTPPPAPPPPVAPAASTADPASSSTPPPPPPPPPVAAATPGDLPATSATSPPPAAAAPAATRSATPPPPPPPSPPAVRPRSGAGGTAAACVPGTLGC